MRRWEPWGMSCRQPSGRGGRSGSTIVMAAISVVATLGCAALTIDVGQVSMTKSRLQSSCDASALAGSASLPCGQLAQNDAALWYLANKSGETTRPSGSGTTTKTYTIGDDTVAVTTPYSDSYTTLQGWDPTRLIEVQATHTVPYTFAAALGLPSGQVVRRSVAYSEGGGTSGWPGGDGVIFAKDQGFALTCNNFTVRGSVYANSAINITVNNVWVGRTMHAETSCDITANKTQGHFTLEYGTTYKVDKHSDIAAYNKIPQVDVTPPITYDPAKYATDFHITTSYGGDLNINQSNVVWPAGTYYVPGNLTISGNNADLSDCTFIVGGSVNVNTNNLQLGCHENNMCFFLLGSGTINLTQNNISVVGDIYAPNGYISNCSNNIHYGWWVARRISAVCNNFELDGLPGRTGGSQVLRVVE